MKHSLTFPVLMSILAVAGLMLVPVSTHSQEEKNQENSQTADVLQNIKDRMYMQSDHGLEDLSANINIETSTTGAGQGFSLFNDISILFQWKSPNKRNITLEENVGDKDNPGAGMIKKMADRMAEHFEVLSAFIITDMPLEGDDYTIEEKNDEYHLVRTLGGHEQRWIFDGDYTLTSVKGTFSPGMGGMQSPGGDFSLSVDTKEIGEEYLISEMTASQTIQHRNREMNTEITISINHTEKDLENGTVTIGDRIDFTMSSEAGMDVTMSFQLEDINLNQGLSDETFEDSEDSGQSDGGDEEKEGDNGDDSDDDGSTW